MNIIQTFDTKIYSAISSIISPGITNIMKVFTAMASALVLCIMVAIIAIFIKNKKYALLISINLVLSTILNIILKNIIQRPRPEINRIIEQGGFSFPSGHSMAAMSFYGFLIFLIIKNINNKYIKWSLVILLSFLILAVGISRIYLGVHYASDVLGAFAISVIYLIAYIFSIRKIILENE